MNLPDLDETHICSLVKRIKAQRVHRTALSVRVRFMTPTASTRLTLLLQVYLPSGLVLFEESAPDQPPARAVGPLLCALDAATAYAAASAAGGGGAPPLRLQSLELGGADGAALAVSRLAAPAAALACAVVTARGGAALARLLASTALAAFVETFPAAAGLAAARAVGVDRALFRPFAFRLPAVLVACARAPLLALIVRGSGGGASAALLAADDEAGGLRALHSLAREGAEALDEVAVLAALGPAVAAAAAGLAAGGEAMLLPSPALPPPGGSAAPRMRISIATPGLPTLLIYALGGGGGGALLLKLAPGVGGGGGDADDGSGGAEGALAPLELLTAEMRALSRAQRGAEVL